MSLIADGAWFSVGASYPSKSHNLIVQSSEALTSVPDSGMNCRQRTTSMCDFSEHTGLN